MLLPAHVMLGGWRGGRPGVGAVQRVRCPSWTPAPGLRPDKLADAVGYPLPPRLFCGRPTRGRYVSVSQLM
jgi:hypothetical protein